MESENKHMNIFNKVRSVPENRTNKFTRYNKELTTINPMWRFEKLTELFGPCGTGWYINVINQSVQEFKNGTALLTLQVELIFKTDSKTWSKGIIGFGSSWIVSLDKAGVLVADDEAYKKAYTDAVGIACKALGFGADIYYSRNDSKYMDNEPEQVEAPKQAEKPVVETTKEEQPPVKMIPASKPAEIKPASVTDGLKKRELTPELEVWKKFIVWAAKKDYLDNKKVRMEIEAKWTMTDENFELLMKEAGRL